MRSAAPAQPGLRAAAESHPGLKRENNEDRYHCDPSRGLFLVVDGVGGHAAGETAAEAALGTILKRLERETGAPLERIREAIALANNEVYRLAQTRPDWQGMACVLTLALVREGRLFVGHVGDTRLYLFDRNGFRKLTHDHSPVGEREDQGDLGEAEAMRHPRRNEIFRDVGSEPHEPLDEDFIETLEVPFGSDAALLICSDGLSDLVPSAEMARLLTEQAADPAASARALIDAANKAGGKDNVTVIVATARNFSDRVRHFPSPRTTGNGFERGTPVSALPQGGASAPESGGGRWGLRLLFLAVGIVFGLALGYVALLSFDTTAGRVIESIRPAGWSRTWRVGAGDEADVKTIAAALDRAKPGDRVEVAPGTYREALVLRGEVRVVSATPRGAVLEPPDAPGEPWTAVRVEQGASGSLSGFTIRSGAARPLGIGVQVFDSELELSDLEVTGASVAGVIMEPGSRATLRAAYIHGNRGAGIIVRTDAAPRLLHDVIAQNGKPAPDAVTSSLPAQGARAPRSGAVPAAAGQPGVEVEAGGRPQFFGNIIADNAGEQVRGLAPDARADLVRDNIVGGPGGSRRESVPAAPRGGGRGGTGSTAPRREGGGR